MKERNHIGRSRLSQKSSQDVHMYVYIYMILHHIYIYICTETERHIYTGGYVCVYICMFERSPLRSGRFAAVLRAGGRRLGGPGLEAVRALRKGSKDACQSMYSRGSRYLILREFGLQDHDYYGFWERSP